MAPDPIPILTAFSSAELTSGRSCLTGATCPSANEGAGDGEEPQWFRVEAGGGSHGCKKESTRSSKGGRPLISFDICEPCSRDGQIAGVC